MLVGAFHVKVRLPGFRIDDAAFPQSEGVRGSAVEPDVEHVRHVVPLIGRQAERAEEVFRRRIEPGFDAALGDGFADRCVQRVRLLFRQCAAVCGSPDLLTKMVIGTPQLRWREISQSGRPSTMDRRRLRPTAGKNSVSSMAFSAFSRSVLAVRARLVHRDEPLRRRAADHRRLRAPGVRIADRRHAAREQIAALGEGLDDFRVRLARLAALLAAGADDVHARKARHVRRVAAVRIDDIANVIKLLYVRPFDGGNTSPKAASRGCFWSRRGSHPHHARARCAQSPYRHRR